MPHLAIQHSANLPISRMQALCEELHGVLVQAGLYPLAGSRVRAVSCPVSIVADKHPSNAFADMILRIGTGRSVGDRKMTGDRLMACAEQFFAKELVQPHFALSLELMGIHPEFNWKANSIHLRLKGNACAISPQTSPRQVNSSPDSSLARSRSN